MFRDVDDIRPGEDFIQAIEAHLREVSAVLVMIGPNWLGASSGEKRRLDDAGDFVRQEIQAALVSGKPLIPLLVSNATMPLEADLPAAIAGLSRRQAVVLSDSNWRRDVERLVKDLRTQLPDGGNVPVKRGWVPGLIGAVIGLAVRMDGISEFGIVWRVMLPSAVPALTAFGIFSVVAHWNDYFWPLIVLNSEHLRTPPLGVAAFRNEEAGTNYGPLMAAAIVIIAPLVIAFLLAQRRFIEGITLTGIK